MTIAPGACHLFECAIGFGPAHGLVGPGGFGTAWTPGELSFHTSAASASSLGLPGRVVTGYFLIARVVTEIMQAANLAMRADWQRIRRIQCEMVSPLWIQDDCAPLKVSVRWTMLSRDGLSISFDLVSGPDKILRRGMIDLWPGEEKKKGGGEGGGQGDKPKKEESESERWFREARMAVSAGKIPKL